MASNRTTFVVEEVEGQADLGPIEPGVVLRQFPLPLHVVHQISSVHELDDEEEPERVGSKFKNRLPVASISTLIWSTSIFLFAVALALAMSRRIF